MLKHTQGYGFSSGHVWMWELDCEESWELKNWCFWTVVLEKTLESPLDCKEIQPVHPKGYQSWVFIGRNDAEAETPVLWPPHEKSWLIGKDSDAGRVWGAGREGDDRGWDGWMASPTTWWTWVWVNSGSWWWTGRPGVLRFMGSQRVGHDWVINWTEPTCGGQSALLKEHWYTCKSHPKTSQKHPEESLTTLLTEARWHKINHHNILCMSVFYKYMLQKKYFSSLLCWFI